MKLSFDGSFKWYLHLEVPTGASTEKRKSAKLNVDSFKTEFAQNPTEAYTLFLILLSLAS